MVSLFFFSPEYGYEIGGVIPNAYDVSLRCPIETIGVVGTKYLYWFSLNHTIKEGVHRRVTYLPRGNPFGLTIHRSNRNFPKSNWTMPDYKTFYRRDDVHFDKPLCIIFNKYTPEKHIGGPKNFIPIPILRNLLDYLTPKYHVVYVRLERKEILQMDDLSITKDFPDKETLRSEYPGKVVILDDLIQDLDADSVNLMIFSLGALCKHFLSIQGATSQVASFFGGNNVLLSKGRVSEHAHGDYGYYWRYANTTVTLVRNETRILDRLKENGY